MRKTFIAALVLCLSVLSARAQFYTAGSDPSNLKWYSTETPYYKLIYPEGADSLARVYGRLLEQFRVPIGNTVGTIPGDLPKGKKMPVVLHTHNPYSNGSVAWAPRRMDLYTLPEPYGSDPTPWEVQLAAHEPRHQAQLQYGYEGFFKYGTWLVGEGFSPIVWALYLDNPLGEGDAVAAETGLAAGTRARTADFLNYFRVAYDNGDWRTWNRWRYGSFKYYTPDYYKIGYMTVAGARVFGEDPMAIRTLMDHSLKKPWSISPYNFKAGKNYRKYAEEFNRIWQEDFAARAPFMPSERLSAKERFPVFYEWTAAIGGTIYLVRRGYTRNSELVSWKNGTWTSLMPFSSHASSLYPDQAHARIYWTETLPDKRWDLEGRSVIRYYDTLRGRAFDLTHEGRLYNPAPSPDGLAIAAAEYPVEGGSALVVVNAMDGSILERRPAPSGVQVVELAWLDDTIYALCLEEGGYSIRRAGSWELVFNPVHAKMCNLDSGEGFLEFVSDASGVNELYQYTPSAGTMTQVTSLRYGGTDFCADGDYLYYVSQTLDGCAFMRTPLSQMPDKTVSPATVHTYPVEDVITAQEEARGAVDRNMPVEFSPARRYRKLRNPLRFHTWLPMYVDYDAVKNASFDFTYDNISLGATAFFQNDLGTLYGAVGYALHPDPDVDKAWRNALHAKFTYAGLYPIFEGSLDIGDRAARLYQIAQYNVFGTSSFAPVRSNLPYPSVVASLRAYIPFTFSKGGVLYGVTPQVRYTVSDSFFSTAKTVFDAPELIFKDFPARYSFAGFREGETHLMHSLSASVRGYVTLPRPHSRIYPKWGIGAEVGGFARLGLADVFAPNVYAYTYAYLPGLYQTHGLRLSATVQKQLWGSDTLFGDTFADVTPRGFNSSVDAVIVGGENTTPWKITADYAIPFTVCGDLSLMPVLYIRNFIFTPHFDYAGLSKGNLWSVGAALSANIAYVFPAAVNMTLGVTASYLGGTWYGYSGQGTKNWHVGPVFDMSF